MTAAKAKPQGPTKAAIIRELRSLATKDTTKMAVKRRVPTKQLLGVSTGEIRNLAKRLGENAIVAEQLWNEPIHELRLLAILMFPADRLTTPQLNRWVRKIDSWGLCDKFAKILAVKSSEAIALIAQWSSSEQLYIRRAGLALLANYCMKARELDQSLLEAWRPLITETSRDDRPHVRQACCWALRELGKINDNTHDHAITLALELIDSGTRDQAWVGRCAHKELETLTKVPQRRRLISANSKTGRKQSV